MSHRQSDGRIVPQMACNAAGGEAERRLFLATLPCKAISRGKHYLYSEIGVKK